MALKLKASTIIADYPTPFLGSHENIILIPSSEALTSQLNSTITNLTQAQNDAGTPQYRLVWVYNEGPESLQNVELRISAQNQSGATTTLQFFNDRGLVSSNPSNTVTAAFPGTVVDGWTDIAVIGNLSAGYAAGVWTKTVGNKDIAVESDFITLKTVSELA